MNLQDLEPNEFNRRYGSEIVEKFNSSNRRSIQRELDWIVTNPKFETFASTVTFKDLKPFEAQWGMKRAALYEYNKRVLNKVRKRLSRSKWNSASVLPVDYITQYEYLETSIFKPYPKKYFHHVHGIFAVRKDLSERIFNFQFYRLDDRLFKDIKSIPTVCSFKIEPLMLEESDKWLRYIYKGKDLNQAMFD